jgi:hypothetical protein
MTDKKTLPNWVLIEAAKRCGWNRNTIEQLRSYYANYDAFSALCDMIERYEQPPVDRKLLCAREAAALLFAGEPEELEFRHGYRDDRDPIVVALRAIELWEKGLGK